MALALLAAGVLVHVSATDAEAGTRAAEALARRAAVVETRVAIEPRLAPWLDADADSVVSSANAIARGRSALTEGIDAFADLRLDEAEAALGRARAAFLDATIAPPYDDLARMHVQLAMLALSRKNPDEAASHFRTAVQLAPRRTGLDRTRFAPSVVEAFAEARRTLSTGPRGTLQVDAPGATILLVDGQAFTRSLPAGDHYIEGRAPGRAPVLMPVHVDADATSSVSFALPALRGAPVLSLDVPPSAAMAAIARTFSADRLIVGRLRGEDLQAWTWDANGVRSRFDIADEPRAQEIAFADPSLPRFFARGAGIVVVEGGAAWQQGVFDDSGAFVRTDASSPWRDYVEWRGRIGVRVGVHERVTAAVDMPVLSKTIVLRDPSVPSERVRTTRGLGDVSAGADARVLPSLWLSGRVQLPTGDDAAILPTGSGQTSFRVAAGGSFERDRFHAAAEAAYVVRLPARVGYAGRRIDPGDEERLRLHAGARAALLTVDAMADVLHRERTPGFAGETVLVDAGLGAQARIGRWETGATATWPVYGTSTAAFFPLDVTAPRASAFVALRFP